MSTIVGSVTSLKDLETLELVGKNFNNDSLSESLNVCKKLDNVITGTKTKQKISLFDCPGIDKTIAELYNTSFGKSISRISRFCKIVKVDNKKDFSYVPETEFVITAVLNINNNICTDHKCDIVVTSDNDLKYIELANNDFVIVNSNISSFFVKGKNTLILILIFDELNYPAIPLITSTSSNDVLISRHSRLYDELPGKNWFKFYVELKHEYSSSITLIIDGTILYASSDYATHCFISKEMQNTVKDIDDDCGCCYSNSHVYTLSKSDLLEKSVCEPIRGGLALLNLEVGKFSASFIGKYPNFKYIKIALSTLHYMIDKKEKISGKMINGYYFYGISHR
ncbi:138R protein [Yaba-like disease virus]|uniref:Protein OPG181 n=1 Tax=Yaba-like disease virus TaxID=132475 RepID=Q9DHH5_YLDV|nr:138R protein [Yaba-like disease virus]CAC21376.1 138R protein [Yaba-like disease virus]